MLMYVHCVVVAFPDHVVDLETHYDRVFVLGLDGSLHDLSLDGYLRDPDLDGYLRDLGLDCYLRDPDLDGYLLDPDLLLIHADVLLDDQT